MNDPTTRLTQRLDRLEQENRRWGGVWGAVALALSLTACAQDVHFPRIVAAGPVSLPAALYRPKGGGPFPAVVALHHCGGRTASVLAWAAWLRDEDYVALAPDSFSPRGTTNVCGSGVNPTVREVAVDAFGALAYLRSLPFVDPNRIAVMSWSYGGAASLIVASRSFTGHFAPSARGFR